MIATSWSTAARLSYRPGLPILSRPWRSGESSFDGRPVTHTSGESGELFTRENIVTGEHRSTFRIIADRGFLHETILVIDISIRKKSHRKRTRTRAERQVGNASDSRCAEQARPGFIGIQSALPAITLAIAAEYADFRFPALGWREKYPALSSWHQSIQSRPSLAATRFFDSSKPQ